MTKSTKAATSTSDLATTKDTAITVQAVSPAPITADVSSQWESFTARPGVAATGNALKGAADGLGLVWAHEKEHGTGRQFLEFCLDASKAIALPILSLVWLALNSAYIWIRKPETKAAVSAKWQALKDWAAPKFNYEREQADESAINL